MSTTCVLVNMNTSDIYPPLLSIWKIRLKLKIIIFTLTFVSLNPAIRHTSIAASSANPTAASILTSAVASADASTASSAATSVTTSACSSRRRLISI